MHRYTMGVAGLAGALFSLAAQAVAPSLDPQPYDSTIAVQETSEPPLRIEGVNVIYGGFIKLDALFSIFSDGRVASTDQGRDYFRPSSIPVTTSAAEDPRSMFDMHAKDSRFFIKADATLEGHKLGGVLELDYRTLAGGASEVVTNGFTPRLRRAVLSYDNWAFGQDWTTFRNAEATPENIDDIGGPVEALNIVRQPLLRYTMGPLQVAFENSETFLAPNTGGGTTATFVTGDSQLPDLVARYDLKTDFGNFGFSGVARALNADRVATGGIAPYDVADGSAFGWGLNVSGKVPTVAAAEVRFGLNYGDGLGRYVSLATVPDAVVDANGGLDTVGVAAAFASYHQPWNAKWRSNLTLGTLQVNNDITLSGGAATKSVDSGHVNLLYQPVDKLLFGAEVMHAIRKLENGDDGTLDRVQFSAKYSF